MDLKLISTELNAETIQVTYTDGPAADNAKQVLILRQPFHGDEKKSLLWTQYQLMQALSDWSSQEFRRLRNELETM